MGFLTSTYRSPFLNLKKTGRKENGEMAENPKLSEAKKKTLDEVQMQKQENGNKEGRERRRAYRTDDDYGFMKVWSWMGFLSSRTSPLS